MVGETRGRVGRRWWRVEAGKQPSQLVVRVLIPLWVVYMAGRPKGGPHCTCASQPMYLTQRPFTSLSLYVCACVCRLPVLGNAGRQTNKVNNIISSFLFLLTLPGRGFGGQVLAGRVIELDYTGLLDGRQAGRQTGKFLLYPAYPIPSHPIPLSGPLSPLLMP